MKNLSVGSVAAALRKAGPYMLVELLLPGGTLIALLLWLSSGTGRGHFADSNEAAATPAAIERVVGPGRHSPEGVLAAKQRITSVREMPASKV